MSFARELLIGLALCAFAGACDAHISSDQSNDSAEYLRRWKVTDAAGKLLSEGCTKQADPRFPENVITVQAAGGSHITYEDNLGAEYMQKERVGVAQQLPTGDAYWCSNQDTVEDDPPWLPGLDTVQVVDADPPAIIEDVQLIKAHQDPQYGTIAEGFNLGLKVVHAGVLHLGFVDTIDVDAGVDAGSDAGADAGTQLGGIYPAMTIE